MGYCPVISIHTATIACKFVKIIEKMNAEAGTDEDSLRVGEKALVQMVPVDPFPVKLLASSPDWEDLSFETCFS